MKIDEAIRILVDYEKGSDEAEPVDFDSAIKLGTEALKFFKGLEDTGALPSNARLPGEDAR